MKDMALVKFWSFGFVLLLSALLLAWSGGPAQAQDVVETAAEAIEVETADGNEASEDAADAPADDDRKDEDEDDTPATQKNLRLAEQYQPYLAVVRFQLQYDKGQPPHACGLSRGGLYLHGLVREERPLELAGYLVQPDKVVVSDPMIHPRFVKSMDVVVGGKTYSAKPLAWGKRQWAMILQLERPVPGVEALKFAPEAEPPFKNVYFTREHTRWTVRVSASGSGVDLAEDFAPYSVASNNGLFVDKEGTPVGMTFVGRIETDGSWKGSPMDWPLVAVEDQAGMLEGLQNKVDAGLHRVTLEFRSPKKQPGSSGPFSNDDDDSETEKRAIGVQIGPGQILILEMLPPKVTARLESITVHVGEKTHKATFVCTLKDYGAMLAKLDEPLGEGLKLSGQNVMKLEDRLLPAAEVQIRGEMREVYRQHLRIAYYDLGFRSQVRPRLMRDPEDVFLFGPEGGLLALPMKLRPKGNARESRYDRVDAELIASADLAAILDNPADHADPSNVPLSEDEENRLAWLGVCLQPMDPELARANNVSHLTHNGKTGAMVSYVYPASPADQAGVKVGWILLRLHAEDQPKPIEVRIQESLFTRRPFPWDRLEQVPEQYFDRIPRPWPPAENNFTRELTDLGFGTTFTADFFVDGKVVKKQFEVTQSPPHFDSAEKFKSEPTGLTVKDLTYELRRYFRRPKGEPGVIVATVEPGSKASIAGMKPYEIITHVNDKPVMTVEDFKTLTADGGELRLSVKRWTRGRVVKLDVDASAPAEAPAEKSPQPPAPPTTE